MIEVQQLGKRYEINARRHADLRSTLAGWWRRGKPTEAVWALDQVSFRVAPGEVVGILGSNGAGKSTLLKILSRITEPTRGRAILHGRLASLLEVGTGFHPELSGRENIFLNGFLLGMQRREIVRNLDSIIDFSGVEKYIDTPVKFYSSGMYVRLAFAVAAHLDAEILVIDEVLAVGDLAFQQKSLRRMNEAARGGRTVLFVSHNMNLLRQLCARGICLEAGKVATDGNISEAIQRYSKLRATAAVRSLAEVSRSVSDGRAAFTAIELTDDERRARNVFGMGQHFTVVFHLRAAWALDRVNITARLADNLGQRIVAWRYADTDTVRLSLPAGPSTVRLRVDAPPLQAGTYFLSIGLGSAVGVHDVIEDAISLEIVPAEVPGLRKPPVKKDTLIYSACQWESDAG